MPPAAAPPGSRTDTHRKGRVASTCAAPCCSHRVVGVNLLPPSQLAARDRVSPSAGEEATPSLSRLRNARLGGLCAAKYDGTTSTGQPTPRWELTRDRVGRPEGLNRGTRCSWLRIRRSFARPATAASLDSLSFRSSSPLPLPANFLLR